MLRAWWTIATQSVGSGPSTLYLIQLVLVRRHGWVSEREYLEDWALSRLSPGVHLVALTALLGRRLAGLRGVATALAGMMLPSGAIAAALAAAYVVVAAIPATEHALAGVGPATIGMTVGITFVFARAAARHGRHAVLDWLVVIVSAGLGLLFPSSPLPVIFAGALFGALFLGRERPSRETPLE